MTSNKIQNTLDSTKFLRHIRHSRIHRVVLVAWSISIRLPVPITSDKMSFRPATPQQPSLQFPHFSIQQTHRSRRH
jgi:hypothetical protein